MNKCFRATLPFLFLESIFFFFFGPCKLIGFMSVLNRFIKVDPGGHLWYVKTEVGKLYQRYVLDRSGTVRKLYVF
jgi:hypothetical protein